MLRPKQVVAYVDDFNEVASDFLEHLRKVRKPDLTIEKLDNELFNWSLESKTVN